MRTLCACLTACLLTGCAASTGSEPERPPLPASIAAPCEPPVTLPERALSDQEVEVLWGRDRRALRACGSRHGAAAGRA